MILLSGRSEPRDVDAERYCFHNESPLEGVGGVPCNGIHYKAILGLCWLHL